MPIGLTTDMLNNPSKAFKSPGDVLLNNDLSREQQIDILERWASQIRAIEVSQYEGMEGPDYYDILETINKALITLGAIPNLEHTPPTMSGG